MKKNQIIQKSRDYLTNLNVRRSIIALCCGICTLALSFYGIISGVIYTTIERKLNGFFAFTYFTRISNIFAALSVAFIIPFAVEGIKKKYFVLPKWVSIFHYISATSVAIMFFFVLTIMSWTSPKTAFGGANVIVHIYCPILIVISFFQIENGYKYTLKDRFIGCILFYTYIVIYFVEVILIGEANGGWPDLYHILEHVSPVIALPLLLLFGTCISWLVGYISNYLTKKREERMFLHWNKDIDAIEAKIEAYGLGNMMSRVKNENSIEIPVRILEYLAKKSHLSIADLIKAYIAGILNARENNQKFTNSVKQTQ